MLLPDIDMDGVCYGYFMCSLGDGSDRDYTAFMRDHIAFAEAHIKSGTPLRLRDFFEPIHDRFSFVPISGIPERNVACILRRESFVVIKVAIYSRRHTEKNSIVQVLHRESDLLDRRDAHAHLAAHGFLRGPLH